MTVSGTGVAGDTITLYDGTTQIGTAVVGSTGTWSLTVNLAVGTHSLTATQTATAPSRLVSVATAPAMVTVFLLPSAPTLSAPGNSISTLTVSGTGVAGDTVSVYDGASNLIGTALVAANGTWSLGLTLALGQHTLSVSQTDPVSHVTSSRSASMIVNVYAQPAPPTIASVSTPAATKKTSPVTVGGAGAAGDTITLYDGATAIGTATVASNGTWSMTVQLAVGAHTLSATQTLGVTSAFGNSAVVTVPAGH